MLIKINDTDYLVGTIHVVSKEFELPDSVMRAVENSTKILVETDPTDLDGMRKSMTLPNGQTMADTLTPRVMDACTTILDIAGVPYDAVKNLKLWAFSFCISNSLSARSGFHPSRNLDARLSTMFDEVIEIEGKAHPDILEKAFKTLSEDELIDVLNKIYGLIPKWEMMLRDVERHVLAGYYDRLLDHMQELNTHAEVNKVMLTDRNVVMADTMEQYFGSRCLTAVGAGHLGGPDGIIQLLKDRGHKITEERRWSYMLLPH
jgi:uncharacterized protein YbaP (TraB family)